MLWSSQGALCSTCSLAGSLSYICYFGLDQGFLFLYSMVPLLFLVCITACALAYVPASPTNSSQAAIAGGLNITDISKLRLQWYSNGSVFLLRISASLSKL